MELISAVEEGGRESGKTICLGVGSDMTQSQSVADSAAFFLVEDHLPHKFPKTILFVGNQADPGICAELLKCFESAFELPVGMNIGVKKIRGYVQRAVVAQNIQRVDETWTATGMEEKLHLYLVFPGIDIVLMNFVVDYAQTGIEILGCLGLVAVIFLQSIYYKIFFESFHGRCQGKRFIG